MVSHAYFRVFLFKYHENAMQNRNNEGQAESLRLQTAGLPTLSAAEVDSSW